MSDWNVILKRRRICPNCPNFEFFNHIRTERDPLVFRTGKKIHIEIIFFSLIAKLTIATDQITPSPTSALNLQILFQRNFTQVYRFHVISLIAKFTAAMGSLRRLSRAKTHQGLILRVQTSISVHRSRPTCKPITFMCCIELPMVLQYHQLRIKAKVTGTHQ